MPELPEVETTRLGITPFLLNKKIAKVIVRHPQLRWPIPKEISKLSGQTIQQIIRRAKYLLLKCDIGTLIIHLGMSGSLRITKPENSPGKHDHIDIITTDNICVRYQDPRRFGAFLWVDATENLENYFLLAHLGPEPLSKTFNSTYLLKQLNKRKTTIKQVIMDQRIVVGVGNIYANEALFLANIHPNSVAGTLTKKQCDALVKAIKAVLKAAIKQGGTTLRNFQHSEGKPGYFKQKLWVYGRSGKICKKCQTILKSSRIGQRNTVFCTKCQVKY